MTGRPDPQRSATGLREFHSISWMWAVVFVLLAGPLNPAGWYLGWPSTELFFLKTMTDLVLIILFPSTVIAVFMLHRMWRAGTFMMGDLWWWSSWGLFFAILAGPLGLIFSGIYTGGLEWSEAGRFYFFMLIWGTLFGVIPYFATVIGLPCALVAMMAAYACTKPVDPAK